MTRGGWIDRVGAALASPRRALADADQPEAAGRAPGDLALLMLAVFVAAYLASAVRAGWLIGAGAIGDGLQLLVIRLGAALRTPLLALLAGVVLVIVAAGRRRRLGADSDLACVAFVPAVVVALLGALILSIAGPVAHLDTVVNAVALLWYAAMLALAVTRARVYRGTETSPPHSGRRSRIAGLLVLGAIAALVAVNGARVAGDLERHRPSVSGDRAPAFALPAIEAGGELGAEVALADLEGKVVLIDFWATWCGPCRTSMPRLEALVRSRSDVVLLSVNVEGPDKRRAAREMVDRLAPSAILVADDAGVSDRYGVATLPHLVLVDGDGVVRHVHRGGVIRSVQRDLAERIAQAASSTSM